MIKIKLKNQHSTTFFLFLIIFYCAILRFYNLNFQSYWLDEIANFNIFKNTSGFNDILFKIKEHPYVPYFYYLLHLTDRIFDLTPYGARVTSVIFGLLGLLTFHLLSSEYFEKKSTRLWGTLIFGLSHVNIYYSQEFAPYSMIMCLVCLSTWSLIKSYKKEEKRYLFLYTLLSIYFVGTHFLMVVFVLSQGLAYLFIIRNKKPKWFLWCSVYAIIVITFLPWLPKAIMLNHAQRLYTPQVMDFFNYYYRLYKDIYVTILISALTVVGLYHYCKYKLYDFLEFKNILLLSSAFLPGMLLFIKSQILTPSFQFRYLTMSFPFIILIQIILLEKSDFRFMKANRNFALLTVAMSISLLFHKYYWTPTHPDFRNLSIKIIEQVASNDILLCNSFTSDEFNFYLKSMNTSIRCFKNINGFTSAKLKDLVASSRGENKKIWLAQNNELEIKVQSNEAARLNKYIFTNLTLQEL